MENAQSAIRVMLFEDHAMLRETLSQLIQLAPGMQLLGAYSDCLSAVAWVKSHQPDVVLMDIDLPGMSGIEGTEQVKAAFPATDILMLTVFEDEDRIFQAMCAGASGYLLKKSSAADILDAIREVNAGGAPMSPPIARKVLQYFRGEGVKKSREAVPEYDLTVREAEILGWLVKGHSYKMISDECEVSINTIRAHLKKVYRKLHVHSMSEAVAKAIQEKLV